MKRAFAFIVASCILAIALLGFVSMAHEQGHGPSCIGSVMGTGCPPITVSLADVAAHIAAAQSFTLGIISIISFTGLLCVIALSFGRRRERETAETRIPFYSHVTVRQGDIPVIRRLHHWLVLHESRDPRVSARVHALFSFT